MADREHPLRPHRPGAVRGRDHGVREAVDTDPGEGGRLGRECLRVEGPGAEGLGDDRVEPVAREVNRDRHEAGQVELRLHEPPAPGAVPGAVGEDERGLCVGAREGWRAGEGPRGGTGRRRPASPSFKVVRLFMAVSCLAREFARV